MLHIAAALEHEGLEALFGQLFGCPTAADAGSDDDGVVGALSRSRALNEHEGARILTCPLPCNQGTQTPQTFTAFEIEGDVNRALYVVRNPDKLRHLATAAAPHERSRMSKRERRREGELLP